MVWRSRACSQDYIEMAKVCSRIESKKSIEIRSFLFGGSVRECIHCLVYNKEDSNVHGSIAASEP